MKLILKKSFVLFSFLLLTSVLLTGCISSLLKEKIASFSNEVILQDPSFPFKKIKSASYPSWKSSKTQNVILIISNCDDSQYSVSNAYQTISENVEDVKIEPSKIDGLNIPKYVTKQIHGTVDDANVEIQTVAFQYRGCVYLSALSGKPNAIAKDFESWKSFLNSIEYKK